MSIVSLLPLARSNVAALCNAYCKLIEKFIFCYLFIDKFLKTWYCIEYIK